MANEMTNDKFEKVQDVLQGLKDDARKANENGDIFMLAIYNDLLHVCSPIVVKTLARLEREEKAVLNKQEKVMRKKAREERNTKRTSA